MYLRWLASDKDTISQLPRLNGRGGRARELIGLGNIQTWYIEFAQSSHHIRDEKPGADALDHIAKMMVPMLCNAD
jgi:hypothetical protein